MKVKICGLRTVEAARAAERAGADFLGFILWTESRRAVSASHAADIVRSVQGGALTVGVVVDQPLKEVAALARRCSFDVIQLHGHEPPEYAERLRAMADVRIIKAFRWCDDFSVAAANGYPADYILLDTFKKGMAGGTGEAFRWRDAAAETRKLEKPLFLAGGISEENAGEAARTLSPFALDVSGSLEEDGEKSPEKIRAFMRTIEIVKKEERR
ncbi:MAG: phosphoribosylanthranilate isomerase [Schwartzia sp.]|nr:phosphoribosylanthranilate isomerase [Schwartzia sp. (in: firmicutes)]